MRTSRLLVMLILLLPALSLAAPEEYSTHHEIYWSENWESGIGSWYASNGIWEVGEPTIATTSHQGSNCAATNLDGGYPDNTDSRFISPSIQLPSDPQDGVLWLRFWHYYNYNDSDTAYFQISVDGGEFVTIGKAFAGYSNWSPYIIDITEYAGLNVRLGLFHNEAGSYESYGWYVDDIEILGGDFEWVAPEGFERNIQGAVQWDGWYAEDGIWQIGAPTYGTSTPASGHYCAATVLNGAYPDNNSSSLISPLVTLPSDPLGGELWLSFMHFYNYSDSEYGDVYILADGVWEKIGGSFSGYSGVWFESIIDLNAYTGKTVRFKFYHHEGGSYEGPGWYIDDIAIVEGPKIFNNVNDFEGGSRGWYSTQGIWEVGIPTTGPGSAYSGDMCWGTRLHAAYPDNNSSTLLSPVVSLPASPNGPLQLKFQQWWSYSDSEYGQVWIYPDGAEPEAISPGFASTSNGWSQYLIDLTPWAGQNVHFGFYHHEGGSYEADGWFIDDVEIIGMDQSTVGTPLFVETDYSQSSPEVSWITIPFDQAYAAVYYSRDYDYLPNLGNRVAMLPAGSAAFTDLAQDGWFHFYQIGLIDNLMHEGVPTGVAGPPPAGVGTGTPRVISATLNGNAPNPFNPLTEIKFKVHRDTHVRLEIFDVRGRKVDTLLDKEMTAGEYSIPFKRNDLASGVYLCRLQAGDTVLQNKMTLLR